MDTLWILSMFAWQFDLISMKYLMKSEVSKRLDYILGSTDRNCPVSGEWSNWGTWSPCHGECGQVGLRERVRECNNPLPLFSEDSCIGPSITAVECRMSDCTEEDYKELTKCDPLRSSEFQILHNFHEKDPSLRERCLFAECHYNIVTKILGKQADRYWNILHCVKHNNGCPVLGGWSQWGRWSECTAEYGFGKKIRCRTCDSPKPTNLKLNCKGLNCTSEQCQGSQSTEPKHGIWAKWSPWSKCTVSCGQGLRKRVRYCVKEKYDITTPLYFDCTSVRDRFPPWIKHKYCELSRLKRKTVVHTFCSGPHSEIEPCFMKSCAVNGEWSEWEPWSQCSVACGIGVQSRSRACSSPPPSGGGAECCGPYTWIRHCYLEPCQVSVCEVTAFTGNGAVYFRKTNQGTRLLHLYTKVKPVCLTGDIIARVSSSSHDSEMNVVRLSLVAGYIVFTASIGHCHLALVSRHAVKIKKWFQVLIMLTPHGATMRIDDNEKFQQENFNCIPRLLNLDSEMVVGGNFSGQIQKLYVNFLKREMKSPSEQVLGQKFLYPSSVLNVIYENFDSNEGRSLDDLILIPCATRMLFSVELVVRTSSPDGILMFVKHFYASRYLIILMEPRRVVLKLVLNDCVYESFHTIEGHIDKWTYILIDYNSEQCWGLTVNGATRKTIKHYHSTAPISCSDNIYVGNVVNTINNLEDRNIFVTHRITNRSISGFLGFVSVNNKSIDVTTLPSIIEKGETPFSSETVSITNNFIEVELLYGQQLNLTCLYGIYSDKERIIYSSILGEENKPLWTRLDIPLTPNNKEVIKHNGIVYKIMSDGERTELKSLQYSFPEEIEGFYSCYLPNPNYGLSAILTYGVTILDVDIEFASVSTKILQLLSYIFLIIFIITIIWMSYEFKENYRTRLGIFTTKSIVKQLSKIDICEMSHDPNLNFILGIENKLRMERNQVSGAKFKKQNNNTK